MIYQTSTAMLLFSVVLFVLIFAAIIYISAKSRNLLSVDEDEFMGDMGIPSPYRKKNVSLNGWEEIW